MGKSANRGLELGRLVPGAGSEYNKCKVGGRHRDNELSGTLVDDRTPPPAQLGALEDYGTLAIDDVHDLAGPLFPVGGFSEHQSLIEVDPDELREAYALHRTIVAVAFHAALDGRDRRTDQLLRTRNVTRHGLERERHQGAEDN